MSTQPSVRKDVIYVDIEDDITSIIEKVKTASASIVALVPPKRIGALQSVVNLKLLNRAADHAKKRVVIITSDHALSALSAGVGIPIAKNLQSKPEVVDAPTPDTDDDEVIDGEEMVPDASGDTDDSVVTAVEPAAPAIGAAALRADRRNNRRGPAIPDFDSFRNKIALIVGGVLLVVVFFVWAVFFAPRATITITAKTTPYSVNKQLIATPDGKLDPVAGTLKATVKEVKKTTSADFTATGKKDVGEKATATVNFSNSTFSAVTLASGTTLTASGSGFKYVTVAAVTVPKGTCTTIFDCTSGKASGEVVAAEAGTKYNTDSGSLSGAGSGVSASFASPTSGGTDKTVTVVSEEDAASAREKIKLPDADSVKAELKKQFATDLVVVEESFVVTPGNPAVSPAVGQEATTGKVTIETIYTMIGLARNDLRTIVEKDLTKQIGGLPDQSIYDQGMDKVRFNSYGKQDSTHKLNLITTGAVGPSINSTELAKQLVGKREGEIVQTIKTFEGIKSVDVRFTPFWVSTAPSADKITIKFLIENAKTN
ncbi:MAG: hypothetical protein WBB39_02375 [Candidatus Saccharimonadales bacterium]